MSMKKVTFQDDDEDNHEGQSLSYSTDSNGDKSSTTFSPAHTQTDRNPISNANKRKCTNDYNMCLLTMKSDPQREFIHTFSN